MEVADLHNRFRGVYVSSRLSALRANSPSRNRTCSLVFLAGRWSLLSRRSRGTGRYAVLSRKDKELAPRFGHDRCGS